MDGADDLRGHQRVAPQDARQCGAVEWVAAPEEKKASKTKPAGESAEGWDVQKYIDQYRPAAAGGAAANFSDPDQNESIDPTLGS
jgi:hypothetical protein